MYVFLIIKHYIIAYSQYLYKVGVTKWENVTSYLLESPTKTQISLCIRAVWSVFVICLKKLCILGYLNHAQWRFWSDCANAQADLNLLWAHMSEGTLSAIKAHIRASSWLNYKIAYTPKEDSDQPEHLPSLIRVFLCAPMVAKDPASLHADSEDSDQTGRMPSLIWVFAGRTLFFRLCHAPNKVRTFLD